MNNENQNTEYKRIWKDEYLKWYPGFANAQGGKIYIGIDDDMTVVGVDNLHKQLEDIPNKIISNTGVFPDTNHLEIEGKVSLRLSLNLAGCLYLIAVSIIIGVVQPNKSFAEQPFISFS